MKHLLTIFVYCSLLGSKASAHRQDSAVLRYEIEQLIASSNAKVGVAISGLDFVDSLTISGNAHFPMQSVYKFHLAIFILHEVDQGRLSLQQQIHIANETLDTATWSPLVRDFPRQDIDISLADLLRYVVSKSDNNGCDVLFRLAGGTKSVNRYMHRLGIREISIAATEGEMKTAWPVQYNNWTSPGAMLEVLRLFYSGTVLKKASKDFLMELMTESENSPNRIHGRLPENAVLAHKTGTSNTNTAGMTAATNDVGITTLPDGRHLAIIVFVSDYTGGVKRGEDIIARIARLAWDHYTGDTK